MSRLQLMPHLSHEELAQRFRHCRDGRQKARWQALWLLARPEQPLSAAQAAPLVGLTADTIRKLVHRYNAGGPAAVARNAGGHGAARWSGGIGSQGRQRARRSSASRAACQSAARRCRSASKRRTARMVGSPPALRSRSSPPRA